MEVKFREVQRFRQPWLWSLLLLAAGVALGVNGYGAFQQLVLGEPWGDRPLSDSSLLLSTLISIVVPLGLLWLFWALELIVEVQTDALQLHFKPLKRRRVPWTEIIGVKAGRYHPLRQYGGWGIRCGRGGWAYNVSGDLGVRLDLRGGCHVLIGTQRPQELAAAIEAQRGAGRG